MLLQFRKLTRGGIALIILLLVSIAMVIFLIPSGLNLAPSNALATVGDREVTPQQLARELELTLRSRRNNGENISQQQAIAAGLHERLLESMIGRTALFAYAEKVGVSASDTQVANYIRDIPGVLNPVSGSFDESAYAQFLQDMRYTRPEFEADIRSEMTTQFLMGSLVSGIRAPSSFGAMAYAYEAETRVVSIAEAPASIVGQIPPPNDAQIQALYEEVQEQLQLPEFRTLTIAYARAQDFMARVNVPEARIQEEFDARRAQLTQPERRSYVRLSAQTEAQANDAAARLGRGETPEAVASALSLQLTRGQNQARTEVPDARVAEAVFSQARGAARAVQGSLTPWAVVRVDAITPPAEPNFAELRGQIRDAIAADEAADLLDAAIGVFEDARSSGATVTEAARQAGFPVLTIPAVEQGGRAQTGEPIEALAGQEALLETAFQTPEGEASDFIPIENADVIVAVDRIIPASVRPLAEVRDDLVRLYQSREISRRLRERADAMIASVEGGQTFAAAARANGFAVRVASQSLNRQIASQLPARGLGSQMFAAQEGAVVQDTHANGSSILVAQVESISRPDPSAAPQIVEAARAQIQQDVGSSFVEALQGEVVTSFRVRRNEQLLEQRFPSAGAGDDQSQ